MADPSAVQRSGRVLGAETGQEQFYTMSLKPVKGFLLLFFQMCSSNVDIKLWLIKYNISMVKTVNYFKPTDF